MILHNSFISASISSIFATRKTKLFHATIPLTFSITFKNTSRLRVLIYNLSSFNLLAKAGNKTGNHRLVLAPEGSIANN